MNELSNYIVSCVEYGECPGGCDYTYRLFEYLKEDGVYYPVDVIYKIYYDDHNDYYVISGEIGDMKYNDDISMLEACIHYLVSCQLRNMKVEK